MLSRKDELILHIANASARDDYDYLYKFLYDFNLVNLRIATIRQLTKFIKTNKL